MSESATLTVTGMRCGGCESTVKNIVGLIDGVLVVNASSKNDQVDVEFENDKTCLDTIKTAITDAGFTVK
ncbi:MAG: heavy-metal-associated domain-containing protein [Methylococcaceae bacterium]|nr:heavy-metal-associated domain-containing protein [Methylococcaceae bacterium]